MNKIEKIKVAVDVAVYYFTITTVLYVLSIILPDLFFYNGMEISEVLRSYAPSYVPLIVVIIFLAILSNLLKKKVQGSTGIGSKTLILIIVGVLIIINGASRIPSYVSLIEVFLGIHSKNQDSSMMKDIYRVIVSIGVYVVQIGIGAYLTFIAVKRDKQIEMIKVAVDVALYYFTITTVVYLLSRIFSDLLFRSGRELISGLKGNILYYAVLVAVILFLGILSNVLKRKGQGHIRNENKQLLFIIVGVLLIIAGVTEIPAQLSWISSYQAYSLDKSISQEQKIQYINTIYWAISHIVFFVFQIGIGAYCTFKAIKRDKHIETTII